MPHSRLAHPRATIAVLKHHGLYTRKALGQHFLIDDNIVGRIVDAAALEPGESVLEVGPGIGTLTDALLSTDARVVAVEYDDRLLPVLAELAGERGGLTVVHADAVTVPVSTLAAGGDPPRALVANLPYAVAATVVLRFFQELPSLERAVVMVQA
ncbi:MAG: rRNA adenine dimethyltransferase family protein, partial [Coriobacteriia bacterium]|nr:rRNA adenine dimethyltransferase family protein [Coriobacteriia bacterium]